MNQSEDMPPIEVDDEGILCCPVCGEQYLHQHEVEIGWRPEDGDVTRHISNSDGVHMDVVPAKEASVSGVYGYRRQYLVVRFWCEHCGDGFELQMRQHKGATILTWVKVGDPESKRPLPDGY